MSAEKNLLKNRLEALLFSCGRAMAEEQLAGLTGSEIRAVRSALKVLAKEYEERETGLKVFNEADSWKLLVKDEYISLVRKIVADTELSRATMETLAIIAYRQPEALQSEVVDIRGGNAYEQITELESLGFVSKVKKGRSFVLKLSEKFYDYFDVEGQQSIRKLFKDVKMPVPKEQQQSLGPLQVVDVLPETKEKDERPTKLLDGLEVVEELPAPERRAETDSEIAPAATLPDDSAERSDWLSKIDEQLDAFTRRNDEVAKDDSFTPRELPGEPVPETTRESAETPETAATPSEPEPVAAPVPASEDAPKARKKRR